MMQRWMSAFTLTLMLAGVSAAQTPSQNPIDRGVEPDYLIRRAGGHVCESEFLSCAEWVSRWVRSLRLSDRFACETASDSSRSIRGL